MIASPDKAMARLIHAGNCVIALAASGAHSRPRPKTKRVAQPERQPVTNAILITSPTPRPHASRCGAGWLRREDRRAKIVPDGVADEACHRGDSIGHVAATDRAQREVVVERQRDIACCDEIPPPEIFYWAMSVATRQRHCRFPMSRNRWNNVRSANAAINSPVTAPSLCQPFLRWKDRVKALIRSRMGLC